MATRQKKQYLFQPGSVGECPVSNLFPAYWNPPKRSDTRSGTMRKLIGNVAEEGQILRALINNDGMIVDGHRRSSACGFLGIPVKYLVLDEGVDPRIAYRCLNSPGHVVSLLGKDSLYVWLQEPLAVDPVAAERFKLMQKKIGQANFRKWGLSGQISNMTFTVAERIWKKLSTYRPQKSLSFLRIVTWLVEERQSWIMKNVMEKGIDPDVLAQLVFESKRVRLNPVVEIIEDS